ncbi:MAG: CDP-diacylglycerol--serine O-phosphatidyltransferase [Bacteroidales bacterium]|nr:CDP-diacylglycerol--serine O-phosphatidyltransferase [Bacteroidales bacterium]MDD4057300.1 CDP-diacylglycerol--serine O-phosphatidyltransferase [Bacteroidales bacterium]
MKLKNSIPNTITSLNLLCGVIAVILAFRGEEIWAVYLVFAAAIFDFLDGFFARLLNAYSPMGKELDSLADLISFGMVPAVLALKRYEIFLTGDSGLSTDSSAPFLISLIPLVIVLFSALRLAKFNVDTRQSSSFIGLPTPANAILIVSFIHFTDSSAIFSSLESTIWFWPALSLLLSFLLVSEIPMFSLKFKTLRWRENKTMFGFLIYSSITAIIFAAISIKWSGWMALIIVSYIIFNFSSHLITKKPNQL